MEKRTSGRNDTNGYHIIHYTNQKQKKGRKLIPICMLKGKIAVQRVACFLTLQKLDQLFRNLHTIEHMHNYFHHREQPHQSSEAFTERTVETSYQNAKL